MTVATLVQEYPQFVANQVLTQDQLNNMREFLDSQNRLTRVRLVGIGIVCGLHTRLETVAGTQRRLTISEGYGITSDGWLIQIEETVYTFIQDYEDPHLSETENVEHPMYLPWQLAYDKSDPDEDLSFGLGIGADRTQIPLRRLLTDDDPVLPIDKTDLTAADLTNKVLLLYLELDETELKSCFTTDCNNKGQSIKLNVRALLADHDVRFQPQSACKDLTEFQPVPRYNTALRMAFGIDLSSINNVVQLNQPYSDVSQFLGFQLASKVSTLLTSNEAFFDIENVATKVSDFQDAINSIISSAAPGQYRYDVLKDIATAYNELVELLCRIVEPCCNTEHFPRHLVIKAFGSPPLINVPDYRHPFYPSPVRNVMHRDYQLARNMFKRLVDLASSFELIDEGIKITPSQNESHPLAKRAIPFYYQSVIDQIWQLNSCCTPQVTGYRLNNNVVASPATPPFGVTDNYQLYLEDPLFFDLNACSHLRIEGHINQNQDTALTNIDQMREDHNLDFQVLSLPLRAEEFTLPDDAPETMMQNYFDIGLSWVGFYIEADEGLLDDIDLDERYDELRARYDEMMQLNAGWCDTVSAIELPCSYEAQQADYNILRYEFLCFLRRCKPMFENLQEINFGTPGSTVTHPKDFCLGFEYVTVGQLIGSEVHEPGELIFVENEVPVTVREFFIDDGPDSFTTFGVGRYRKNAEDTEKLIELNQLNLSFDLGSQLDCTVKEVRFHFIFSSGLNNIGVNNQSQPTNINFSSMGDTGPQPLFGAPSGVTIEVISEVPQNDVCTGIIRGDDIFQVTIGGSQDFQLLDFCVKGETQETLAGGQLDPIEIPDESFDVRFQRQMILCDLLEQFMTKDLRCFNYLVFRFLLKDFIGTGIEIKLLLGCMFKSVNGAFATYNYYPYWSDFESCLDQISSNCFFPEFTALYLNFRATWNANIRTFGAFVEKYPGVEHRAGVSKGGTFIMVYEEAANPAVLADFSLEHFVDDCCACEVPIPLCPPVALSDYRVYEISEETSLFVEEFSVALNDFDPTGEDTMSIENTTGESDRGGTVDIVDSAEGIVRYQIALSSSAPVFLDHFTYRLNGAEGEDLGHVYIALYRPKNIEQDQGSFTPTEPVDTPTEPVDTSKPAGTGTGKVVDSETGAPVTTAIVSVHNQANAQAALLDVDSNGDFSFAAAPGEYRFEITAPNYFSGSFGGNTIVDDVAENFGEFQLRRRNLQVLGERVDTNSGVLVAAEDILSGVPVLTQAQDFVQVTAKDENVPIEDVSKDYEAIVDELLAILKAQESSTATKRAATDVLESVTHTFMDVAVAHQPKVPNPNVLEVVKGAVDKMKTEGVSMNRILTNWKSNNLKTAIGGQVSAVDAFRNEFKV